MAIRGFFTLDYLNMLHDLLSGVAWVTSGADLHPSEDGQMLKAFQATLNSTDQTIISSQVVLYSSCSY